MKPLKHAVSLVVKDDAGKFLIVKRPDNRDDGLGGVWGFPAVTLKEGESELDGCKRIGSSKLGVEVEVGQRLGQGEDDRKNYHLNLADYEAKITAGTPTVPQGDTTVTQYEECKFTDDPTLLFPAARKGSVCTQIFLESIGQNWGEL